MASVSSESGVISGNSSRLAMPSNNLSMGPPMTSLLVMRLNRTWEIRSPPALQHMVGGVMVPSVKGTVGRSLQIKSLRRLAIEIHGPEKTPEPIRPSPTPSSAVIHVRPNLLRTKGTKTTVQLSKELLDDDRVVVRIFKRRRRKRLFGIFPDSESDSDFDSDSEDDENDSPENKLRRETEDDWVEYRKFGLDAIADMKLEGRSVYATLGFGHLTERRQLQFETDEQALDFVTELMQLQDLVKERAQIRLQAFQVQQQVTEERMRRASGSISALELNKLDSTGETVSPPKQQYPDFMKPDAEIHLLIEIVSATDLPIGDLSSGTTDPFVVIYMGTKLLHETKYVPKTFNPVWTVANGSLFLLSVSAQEFFESSSGLTFSIQDFDGLSSSDVIGEVTLDQTTLLSLPPSARIGYPIGLLKAYKYKSSSKHFHPTLYLRVRPARMPEDKQFMKQVYAVQRNKASGVYADQKFVSPKLHTHALNLLKREVKRLPDGTKQYRTKPGPDPERPSEKTKWLDKAGLLREAMLPSSHYVEAGTGTLGRIFLEVLCCEGLPEMDVDGTSDPFCCLIYEDAIVNTCVIPDTVQPKWMPWSQRAFIFHMSHSSSQILIGVYDFDTGVSAHDFIGRVGIDITNFREDTEYLLTFNLHSSVLDKVQRESRGKITVRLRLEYESYRDFIRGSLQLPPVNTINLAEKTDFRTAYYAIHGEENLDRFDFEAVAAYRREIQFYISTLVSSVTEALTTLIFWRGHFNVKFLGLKARLPLHSMTAFVTGVLLIENLDLFPSFSLFGIAWLLLATNEKRRKNPSPWHRTLAFYQIWFAFLANKAPPVIIDAYENEGAIRKYNQEVEEQREAKKKKEQGAREQAEKLNDFLSTEANSAAEAFEDRGISTLDGGIQFNLFAKALLPVQKALGQLCKSLRIFSSILSWDESIYAFLIVNLCLISGVLVLWVPWSFLFRWTFRVLIWVVLGPWMKLVDILYLQKVNTNEKRVYQQLAEQKLLNVGAAKNALMLRKEHVLKLKAMKHFMFGRFVTRVPQLKEYRYPDVPLAESQATPYIHSEGAQAVISLRSHGQSLEGSMIPVWGDALENEKLPYIEDLSVEELVD